MSIPARDRAMETGTGPMLLAVEAVPESQAVIAQAARLARRSRVQVLVLSVRERDYVRGFAWDEHQPGASPTRSSTRRTTITSARS